MRLVKGDTVLNTPKKYADTGSVKSPANTVDNSVFNMYSMNFCSFGFLSLFSPRCIFGRRNIDANTPDVAKTDRRKLNEVIIYGLFRTNRATAKPKEFKGSASSLKNGAIRKTDIIMEALTTEGVNPETIHSPQRNIIQTVLRSFSFTLKSVNNAIMQAHQVLVCNPETARRWEIPVARKSFVISPSMFDLSPKSIPVRKPARYSAI